MKETLEVPKLDISDVLVAPKPFPDVAQELKKWSEGQEQLDKRAVWLAKKFGTLRTAPVKGKRRRDGSAYTSVPRAIRKSERRARAKVQRASRQKNRV